MRSIILSLIIFLSIIDSSFGQENTIALLEIDTSAVSDGYILMYPENQSTVYLINNCGEIVHSWSTDEVRISGKDQYLDPTGKLYLASIQPSLHGATFGSGGAGGVIEILDWDGTVEWQLIVADTLQRQHHDIHIMPNGNVMFIAWENISLEVAANHGFDTLNNSQIGFWPDKIVEVDPNTSNIVWQWRAIDHMVQDIDSSKMNYGIISDHPELININYLDFAFGRQDVHHVNSIDYNEALDMVMISVRNFNEVWIIDHSTSIDEAASHSGGVRNKGGDLLYRWGNDAAFDSGDLSDQQLFRQHDAAWIDDVPEDHPYYGQVSVYNNFIGSELSKGEIFNPVFNESENAFELENNSFLPLGFTASYSHPIQEKTFSAAASNIQMLPNGNVFMCAARQGRMFELSPLGNLVWEYLVPIRNGFPIMQGQEINLSENFTFSGRRYGQDFSGFESKDLSPKGYIELDPNESFCSTSVNVKETIAKELTIYPNPISDYAIFTLDTKSRVRLLDMMGNIVQELYLNSGQTRLDLSHLSPGIYIIHNSETEDFFKVVKL